MKQNNKKQCLFIFGAVVILCMVLGHYLRIKFVSSLEIQKKTWEGFKHFFIDADGMVKRPRENDSISEGQAYAMLRAVLQNDKKTFDACYKWSEENLSRYEGKGDHLLAWHWQQKDVIDWMPASDADIDYALSLIFASWRWKNDPPRGVEDYAAKARNVLDDVLRLETFSTKGGRIYLAPWILDKENLETSYPQNPSYYSPGHFRVFYMFTGNAKWTELYETSYFVFNELLTSFNGQQGIGVIPDWCRVDDQNRFLVFEGKSSGFGWEAARIPLRVAMDYFWFNAPEAKSVLGGKMRRFFEGQWERHHALFCEYNYDGTPKKNKYENPLFYTAYYSIFKVSGAFKAWEALGKIRSYLRRNDVYWIYKDNMAYFENSLAWFSEAFESKAIIEYLKKGEIYAVER